MGLSQKQRNFIELMLANPMLPDTQLAEKFGINRATVRRWKEQPEFQEELKRKLAEQWRDSERAAMETMISLCREGDFKASKYILDSLGYAPTQKVDANVHGDIDISIGIDDED